jgi:hypothetical protein
MSFFGSPIYKHITATGSRLNNILQQSGNPTDLFWGTSLPNYRDDYSLFVDLLSKSDPTKLTVSHIMYGIINTFQVDFENNRDFVTRFVEIFHVDSIVHNIQNNYVSLLDLLNNNLRIGAPPPPPSPPPPPPPSSEQAPPVDDPSDIGRRRAYDLFGY